MARVWHIANGHLATGEKDGGHVVILLRPEEAQARTLSHTQREVLDQLEHAAMPFLERTSTGAAGLVVTPSGRHRFGFILIQSGRPAFPFELVVALEDFFFSFGIV